MTPLVLPQVGARSDSPVSSSACPQPPGLLPRTVAPPTSGASASTGMEAMWEARLSRQSCLGSTRLSDSGSGFGIQPPQELPPLREAQAMSSIPSRGELEFLCDPVHGDLKTPGGRLSLRSPNVRQSAGRLSQSDMRIDPDGRVTFEEMEHLKRQVTRLTQLRRDRDNYIQDLLQEAEATQRRHETEMGRQTVRTQREAVERLSAQQREHDLHLEERSRAHAAALAQQAWQHEREIEELRKSLRFDGERRQAEKFTEFAKSQRDTLLRLQLSVEELRQRLIGHLRAFGEAAVGDELLLESKETDTRAHGLASLAPIGAAEEEALAEHAAKEASESVERAISLVRKDLERVLKTGASVTEHAATAHKSHLQEAIQFEQQITEAKASLERDRRTYCLKSQEFAAVAAAATSETLLLKVLLVWSNEVRRLRLLVAEQQRDRAAAAQQQQLVASRQQAESLQVRLSSELKTQSLRLGRTHMGFLKRLTLFRWAVATRDARREAAHRRQLITTAADASAEVYKLRGEAKKAATDLRKQRRAHGVAAIHANLDRRLQSVLLAWSAVVREGQRDASYQRQLDIAAAESAAGCAVLRMEGRRTALDLREQRRNQALRAIDSDCRCWRHVVLREWLAQVTFSRQQVHWEKALAGLRKRIDARSAAAEASRCAELHAQSDDSEARVDPAASSRDIEVARLCEDAQATEISRLCAEREALQAQIESLHDELRRRHGQA